MFSAQLTKPLTFALFAACVIVIFSNCCCVRAWWLFSDQQQAIKAVANFDLDGVKGSIKFSQANLNEPTLVDYDLFGLQGNNKFYHVHVRPVPAYKPDLVKANQTAIAQLCADPATGGHLNPHHITQKLPPKSAPLDKYEVGDLSGKHGPMVQIGKPEEDHYQGNYIDDKLPLTGENGIIGRSIVIHKNDGKRWVCANIIAA